MRDIMLFAFFLTNEKKSVDNHKVLPVSVKKEIQMLRTRFIIAALALLGILCVHIPVNAQETLSVQVREGELRATPSFLGKIVARVAYGDRVVVVGTRGAWKKVSIKGGALQGWMHTSALTTRRIALKAGQTAVRTGATQDELALAGKGFNEQVEAAFRKENRNLDYTWINRMETFKVSPDLMSNFLAQGNLVPPAEGGKP
ncbi:MAG TPA: SH3 domain-containing protein [Syntrophaceae bacterium]|nr:SH3 domain-containing protein [Syntrophaceae bacterium]